MFDIGFFELCIIGVVALLVLGPERLPHAARMTGAWIGKFRRTALSVREELEREVNAYEAEQRIKAHLDKHAEDIGLNELNQSIKDTQEQLRNGILDDATLKEIEERGLQEYSELLSTQAETNAPEALPKAPAKPSGPAHE